MDCSLGGGTPKKFGHGKWDFFLPVCQEFGKFPYPDERCSSPSKSTRQGLSFVSFQTKLCMCLVNSHLVETVREYFICFNQMPEKFLCSLILSFCSLGVIAYQLLTLSSIAQAHSLQVHIHCNLEGIFSTA